MQRCALCGLRLSARSMRACSQARKGQRVCQASRIHAQTLSVRPSVRGTMMQLQCPRQWALQLELPSLLSRARYVARCAAMQCNESVVVGAQICLLPNAVFVYGYILLCIWMHGGNMQ